MCSYPPRVEHKALTGKETADEPLTEELDVAGSPPGVIGKGHGGTAEHVEVRDHAAPGEPLAEAAESIFGAALSSSGEESFTLRRFRSRQRTRRACGRLPGHGRGPVRAPGVSNGNQKRLKPRSADHAGAP